MKISFIIPARNEEQLIGSCLDCLQRNADGRFCEIIVVDSASSDRTAEIARRRPGVRVVREPMKGLTRARQRGLQEANGDLLAYIDADTRLPAGWIESAQGIFAARPEVVCLSGPYRYYDGTAFQRLVLGFLWILAAPISYRIVGYMVLGGNFIARKHALEQAGCFDSNVDFYGEDTIVARRLSKIGKVLFRMDFFNYTSARRFKAEGMLRTIATYVINFLWPVLLNRPFSTTHRDIREPAAAAEFSRIRNDDRPPDQQVVAPAPSSPESDSQV